LPVAAQDVPVEIRPIVMAAELAKNTSKLGGIETFKPKDVSYITRIGEVVAGGKEAHKKIHFGRICLSKNSFMHR
jgi:hypothetical protein